MIFLGICSAPKESNYYLDTMPLNEFQYRDIHQD